MLAAGVAPAGDSPPKAVRPAFAAPRRWRKPLGVTLLYRGGPECSWYVSGADFGWRFPGHIMLADMALRIGGPTG